MYNWIKSNSQGTIITYCHRDEPIILHVIPSNGLRSRSEAANGYSFIIAREDAFGGSYPAEYLTAEQLYKKYGVKMEIPSGIERDEPILCACCGSSTVGREGDMCGTCSRPMPPDGPASDCTDWPNNLPQEPQEPPHRCAQCTNCGFSIDATADRLCSDCAEENGILQSNPVRKIIDPKY